MRLGLVFAVFAAILVSAPAFAADDRIESRGYDTLGRVRADGDGVILEGPDYSTRGRATPTSDGWRLEDASYSTLGRLVRQGDGWIVEDAGYATLGRLVPDGGGWRVEDHGYTTLGHVDADGRAQDADYGTIAYLQEPSPVRVAALYFFPALLKP